MKKNCIVITSINDVTEAVKTYSQIDGWEVIVVADKKSAKYSHENVEFLSIQDQLELPFNTVISTPFNHYSRKNIGYLHAIKKGVNMIYDTDDDTIPTPQWNSRDFICDTVIGGDSMINPYALFSDKKIWPRGFNLSLINKRVDYTQTSRNSKIGVWQGLINGDSDFDAIYRLTVNEHIVFNEDRDIAIHPECFAPFNTQSTLWNKELFPLLYIPQSVDFRFTDILRGFVAQKIMWNFDFLLGFHHPNTYQVRNEHDYYLDFLGEISMYKNTPIVIQCLNDLDLTGNSIDECLFKVYTSLYNKNIVEEREMLNLSNWILDIKNMTL